MKDVKAGSFGWGSGEAWRGEDLYLSSQVPEKKYRSLPPKPQGPGLLFSQSWDGENNVNPRRNLNNKELLLGSNA